MVISGFVEEVGCKVVYMRIVQRREVFPSFGEIQSFP